MWSRYLQNKQEGRTPFLSSHARHMQMRGREDEAGKGKETKIQSSARATKKKGWWV